MDILQTKAKLLELENVGVSVEIRHDSSRWNLFKEPHIFVRLGPSSRVKMRVVDEGPLKLVAQERGYTLELEGSILLSDIEIEEAVFHCPKQISVCYYYECIMGCRYCPLPTHHGRPFPSKQDVIGMIVKIGVTNLQGVAFTHGIPRGKTPEEVIDEIIDTVEAIRAQFGHDLPIGVGPHPCGTDQLQSLFDAGANEARINLEAYNRDLFRKLCPAKDYNLTMRSIEDAVKIFGFNKVSSSLLVGVGESNTDLIEGVEVLSKLGVVPTLHPLDTFAGYKKRLGKVLDVPFGRPSADRLISLARSHKEALVSNGLDPRMLRTTCPGCTACSLMPIVNF